MEALFHKKRSGRGHASLFTTKPYHYSVWAINAGRRAAAPGCWELAQGGHSPGDVGEGTGDWEGRQEQHWEGLGWFVLCQGRGDRG